MTPAPNPAFDDHMMGIALHMAWVGVGTTAPNPSVGAVMVAPGTGEVVGRGTTAAGGRPHAETVAIARACERARGATLYVTLEPCSHQGQTPPCADAIIAAGVARVVCAIEDPDPRVAGRGLARLRAAGIAVTRGVRASEAAEVTRGHIVRVTERRPTVTLKLALGADGSVPGGRRGKPTFVTSPEARAAGHMMRARTDAILVGSGTVAVDNPELTCRLPGLIKRSPGRIVLARQGIGLVGTRLAATIGVAQLTVVCAPDCPADRVAAMKAAGADVIVASTVGRGLWLPSVLEMLAQRGITRLLVEGGPTVWHAFAQSGLVDEVVLFIAGGEYPSEQTALGYARNHLGPVPLAVSDRRKTGIDMAWRLTIVPKSGSRGFVPLPSHS